MRCLYCGKELALFKRLRGGEFCSDAHRLRYQEEYTQLALNRLLQANSSKEPKEANDSSEKEAQGPLGKPASNTNGKESKTEVSPRVEPIESPAMKRRDRLKNDDAPGPALSPAPSTPTRPSAMPKEPMAPAARAGTSTMVETRQEVSRRVTAPEPEPEPIAVAIEAPDREQPPPAMAGMLLELPVPTYANVADFSRPELEFCSVTETVLPLAQETPATVEGQPSFAGKVLMELSQEKVNWSAQGQRAVEVREFVRSVPVVEIHLKPAGETNLPGSFEDPLEIGMEAYPVESAAVLAQEAACEFPPLVILFQETARLDFEPTLWGETVAEEVATLEQAPAAQNIPAAVEASRMEPVRLDPVHFETARPQTLHIESVQIEPVFAERVLVNSDLAGEVSAGAADVATDSGPAEIAEAPVPDAVTRPEPVTLHGIAPTRGKPMQIFASALPRTVEIQAPRQSSLPLRPVMVFGTEAPSAVETKSAAPSIPPKQDARGAGAKRKPEVRVVALPAKMERKLVEPKAAVAKVEEPKPAEVKQVEVKQVEVKQVEVKAEVPPVEAKVALEAKVKDVKVPETKPVEPRPAAVKTSEPSKAAPKKEELRKPTPEPMAAEAPKAPDVPNRPAPLNPAAPIPDLLGLPQLSLQNSQSAWSRIPVMLRVGIFAAILAAAAAGIFLTSHGSGATNAKGKGTPESMVEVGPALSNTGGWIQDWFTDPRGSKLARHLDVLRGSLAARDYRLELEGQIDQGGIGWVFRANNKSFYAEKVAIVKPGLEPTIALIRIAVIDGQEVSREQIPLTTKVHLDTLYKIRMDAVGHRFTTFLQDQQADEWNDSRIEGGGVGLYYEGGDSAHLKGTLNVTTLIEK